MEVQAFRQVGCGAMLVVDDLTASTRSFRSWAYFGLKKLQLDNRRTFLGSGWLVLSFALTVLGVGLLMSELQGLVFREHVRYVALGFACWNFISAAIVSGCSVFLNNRSFLLQLRLPKTAFVHALMVRLSFILILQMLTAIAIALFFGWRPTMTALEALPALLFYILSGYGVALMLGCITTRFQDIAELTSSFIRIAFFFTPVIWLAERRAARFTGEPVPEGEFSVMSFLFTWNPFAHYIEVVRGPLMGVTPSLISMIVVGASTLILVGLGLLAFQMSGRRLNYWL